MAKKAQDERDERRQAAQIAIDQIKEKFGEGAIMRLGEAKKMEIESQGDLEQWLLEDHDETAVEVARRFIEAPEPEPEAKPTSELIATGLPEGYESFRVKSGDDQIERKAKQYLYTRGVTRELIVEHKIGYAAVGTYAWRVLFPVIWQNEIFGVVGRDFSGKTPGTGQSPKYLNSPGIKLLWGAHRKAKVAIVCEGILDAIRVEQAVGKSQPAIAVARLGSTITPNQLEQLSQYERVCIFPDGDLAGIKGALARIISMCGQSFLRLWTAAIRVVLPQMKYGNTSVRHNRGLSQWNIVYV